MKKQKTFNAKCGALVGSVVAIALCGVGLSFIGETNADAGGERASAMVAPKISIDTEEYSLTSIPSAALGNAYRIFDASATDAYGDAAEVKARVYLYYSSETRSRIYLENGEFTPSYYGVYTVEYTATDRSGNTSVSTYEVACERKEPLKATVVNEAESGVAGVEITLSGLDYENAIGSASYEITVTHADGKAVYELGDETSFVPMYAGEYIVEYAYSDYNERGTTSYTFTVAENDSPVIFDSVTLPKYFLVGCEYTLPTPKCYGFALGKPVKLIPTVTVQYKGGKSVVLDSTAFTPTEAGELTVTYTATFDGVSTADSYEVVAVDVGYTDELKMANYLYGDSVTANATSNAIELLTATDGAQTEFINAVLAASLTVDFGFDLEQNEFSGLDIWLTDSVDSAKQVKFSILKDSENSSNVAINDKLIGKTTSSFFDDDIVTLAYDNGACTASIGDSESAKVKTTYGGDPFEGFTSNFVYVRLAFTGVTGTSKVSLSKINNQTLFNEGDSNIPHVVYSRYSHGKKTVGDLIEIEPVYVGDVLTPNYTVRYYVKSPDGSYTVDENGTLLSPESTDPTRSYRFIAKQLGRYLVTIGIADGFGNEYMYSYAVNILDMELPVIRLSDTKNETAKVGSNLKIKSATVTDNVSENIAIFVYVIDPNGVASEYKRTEKGFKYKLSQKGEYTVQYYAFDEAGNTAITGYTVTVK
ncbi:MAG: hypothetical protein IJ506_04355 [Clostridia bacterium]|nr:hypothetical protein [Clostridia bacterium]